MSEKRLREELLDARVPDARDAEERGWRLVRAAYVSSPPPLSSRRRRGGRRWLQVAIAVGLLAALVISPAGAKVRHWVRDAVEPAREPALPALTSLPAPGALLVDSPRGVWIVHEDGSKRLLGAYSQSAWSPHGLYVAATGSGQLLALDPQGEVRWAVAHLGSATSPAWSPDGYRVAYLNAGTLRVVGGDGTGDRPLERRVAPATPAWRPGHHHVITLAERTGSVRTVDADSGTTIFEKPPGPLPTRLEWSPDGLRLLVVRRSALSVLDRDGDPLWSRDAPAGMQFGAATFVGDADRVAAVLGSRGEPSRSELLLFDRGGPATTLFAGPGLFSGVVASPDGGWLLLAWQSADQWLFLDLAHPQRVVAVSDISAQFDPGTTSPSAFPELAGWCCRKGG